MLLNQITHDLYHTIPCHSTALIAATIRGDSQRVAQSTAVAVGANTTAVTWLNNHCCGSWRRRRHSMATMWLGHRLGVGIAETTTERCLRIVAADTDFPCGGRGRGGGGGGVTCWVPLCGRLTLDPVVAGESAPISRLVDVASCALMLVRTP